MRLSDAARRHTSRALGRESRMNYSLHGETQDKVIAPVLEKGPNGRSAERAGWKHGPLIEGNGLVRARIPNTSARAAAVAAMR